MKISKFQDICYEVMRNSKSKAQLFYMVEKMNWSIKHDGENITKNLSSMNAKTTLVPYGTKRNIVHFGSMNLFMRWMPMIRLFRSSKKLIVTWFHVSPNDARIKLIDKYKRFVSLWHTSCLKTKMKIITLGVPEEKISVIPLGVNTNIFSVPNYDEKIRIRKNLGIKDTHIVIGSFQKDGNGWGEGLNPKMIKGPDILCDVIERLSKKFSVFVLLTGPARGYVKARLSSAGIPHLHRNFEDPNDISIFYKAIDLYLITSRVEGGPKSLLESAASGVPLVSTKVGMAPEFIADGENGFLCNIQDVDDLVKKSSILIKSKDIREEFTRCGRIRIASYDWKIIAKRYFDEMYCKLLS